MSYFAKPKSTVDWDKPETQFKNPPRNPSIDTLLPTTVLSINKYMDDEVCMQPGKDQEQITPGQGQVTLGVNQGQVTLGCNQAGTSTVIGGNNVVLDNLQISQPVSFVNSNIAIGQSTNASSASTCNVLKRESDEQEGASPPKLWKSNVNDSSAPSVLAGQMTDQQKINLIKLLQANKLLNSITSQNQTVTSNSIGQFELTSASPSGAVINSVNAKLDNSVVATPQLQPELVTYNPDNVQEQNLSPVKGNLFDNFSTILSTANSVTPNAALLASSISNQVNVVQGPSQNESPPILTPAVKGLSPKFKDKVSTFAASLQSASLVSKLQVLSKSPTKSSGNQIQVCSKS